jgi:hypothetical protein
VKFADLHLHTLYSDSTYTPEQLIRDSKAAGLSAISVVDHDTIDGIDICTQLGKKEGVEVIPGIELSAEYENKEVHILGYFIDHTNKAFKEKLDMLKSNRRDRVYKIIEKLKKVGIDLDPEKVFSLSDRGTVGRLHIARAMVEDGHVRTIYDAFYRFIGDRGPAFVLGFRFTPHDAVKLIKGVGGIPVLAHPYVLNDDQLIVKFVEFGVMGLEVYYPEHSQSLINVYLEMARKYNLLVTGGSDCHGTAKPEVKIGLIKIPYELVEKIKAARGKL